MRLARFHFVLAAILLAALAPVANGNAAGDDQVTFLRDKSQQTIGGKLLVTAQDGGLMLLSPDGMLWNIEPNEIVSHTHDNQAFAPLSAAEAGKRVQAELPGFQVLATAHYVICYGTSRVYAQWVGALYERLYNAFATYWPSHGVKLHDPELPLVVLVFPDQESYAAHAKAEIGEATKSIIGFYSLRSNRVTMYDLTGVEAVRRLGGHRGSAGEINQLLAQPEAAAMVATIIHEATHQLAFNRGLQARFADVPLWVSEGIALYFETPDLHNSRGWQTVGAVNRPRLDRFRQYLRERPTKSLESLMINDHRFRDARQALDAYAEAWALTYFLVHQKPKQYTEFVETMAAKKALFTVTPEQRLAEFKLAFGNDLGRLDTEFVKYMQRMR
ncbi:MAG TPA: DUF1570 domain-containing protein [Pirellulales bacterium]|jgi:hypothetical protein|nr:DUF1570 domain-containing protein [Pirellulales bacterium]